jgi:hypothetical protein
MFSPLVTAICVAILVRLELLDELRALRGSVGVVQTIRRSVASLPRPRGPLQGRNLALAHDCDANMKQ